MSRGCKILIFDFDGVLVDSEPVKTEAFRKIFSRYPEHAERMMRHHLENPSVSRVHKFRYFQRECLGMEDAVLLNRLLEDFAAEVTQGVIGCPAIDGARQFLEEVHGKIPIYLASVTPVADLKTILKGRGLSKFFKKVYGDPPTAKADAIREILQTEGCKPEETLLIGDSEGDFRAARETGIQFLGYRNVQGAENFSDWSELGGLLRLGVESVQ